MKKYNKYKDSNIEWLGEIPASWSTCKIKHVCRRIFAGATPSTSNPEYWDGNIPWIPSGCCHSDDIVEAPKFITEEGLKNSSTKLVPANTAVLAMTGATCANVGFLKIEACTNQSVTSYIANPNKASSRYLFYLLQGMKDYILSYQSGGAQAGINVEDCSNFTIPLCSLFEQSNIATYLDYKVGQIDKAISEIEQQVDSLKSYRQSLISETVTKGLDKNIEMKDSALNWIGEIPKEWETNRIKSYFKFNRGLNITKADLVEVGIPVISYGQIHSKRNNGTTVCSEILRYVPKEIAHNHPECKVNIGDIIFADTSEDKEGCGNCVYVDTEGIYAGYHSIVLKGSGRDNKFLAYLFKSDEWRSQIRSKANGVKVYSITQGILANCTIILPPTIEQKKITKYLDNKTSKIDLAIDGLRKQQDDLATLKQSIINEAVTGKIDVRDWTPSIEQ